MPGEGVDAASRGGGRSSRWSAGARVRRTPRAAAVGLLAVMALAQGCGGKTSSATSPSSNHDSGRNNPSVYVAFGDSITFGILKDSRITSESYPAQLERRLRSVDSSAQVINRGVPGEHTSEGLARFDSVLVGERPGFILILEGTNDLDSSSVSNLREMVRRAKANKTVPLVATIPRQWDELAFKNSLIEILNGRIAAMAAIEGVTLVDAFNALNSRDLFGGDGLHPNEAGYAVLADAWFSGILSVR